MTCYWLNGLIFTTLKDWTEAVLLQGVPGAAGISGKSKLKRFTSPLAWQRTGLLPGEIGLLSG
jgi:hypothetical protein